MSFGEIVNLALYAFSGFCFGIFASRQSVFAFAKLAAVRREHGFIAILGCPLQLVVLLLAFFLFPVWFVSRTQLGGFVYYAVLFYFFNKGSRR